MYEFGCDFCRWLNLNDWRNVRSYFFVIIIETFYLTLFIIWL